MRDRWIGEEVNTSGSYRDVDLCKGLKQRYGGPINPPTLYTFKNPFGNGFINDYYISDPGTVAKIREFIINKDDVGLQEYIYTIIIATFGVLDFLQQVEKKIEYEQKQHYEKGVRDKELEIRKVLGF